MNNQGVTQARVHLSGMTCASSPAIPLRATRLADGTLDATGDVPLDVLAAGVDIEVVAPKGGSLQCQLVISGSQ